jgi:hypothetical protein
MRSGKGLATIALGTVLLAGVGCDESQKSKAAREQEYRMQVSFRQAQDALTRDINKIAVYTLINGRRMQYNEFTDITGIKRELGEEFSDLPVWVNVSERTVGLGVKQRVDGNSESGRHVFIDVPYGIAQNLRGILNRFRDELYGLEPADQNDLINPPGDY